MKSYWIWNYGDYAIYHANLANARRQAYGVDYPVFWKVADVERNVRFRKQAIFETDGKITVHINGIGYFLVDGERYGDGETISVSAGMHSLEARVENHTGLPALFVESDLCASDDSWTTGHAGEEQIPAEYDPHYDSPDKNPEVFPFSYQKVEPISSREVDDGILFDFGKELYGFLHIDRVPKDKSFRVCYGESKEEALDFDYSLVREDCGGAEKYRLRGRAFRYIFLKGIRNATVYADYEYVPLPYKGHFECDDEAVNKIWDMCAYTLHLTSREVHLEAIKRDRWLWGGDAYQAYKFNNYLFFDKELIKRSTVALRGKDPVVQHINTITDYTLYWVIGLYEYYETYGDKTFIERLYPKAESLMDFCKGKLNEDGFIVGKADDWIFIDWADDLEKEGAPCAEQMLYIAANRTMAKLADLLGKDSSGYAETAKALSKKVTEFYWNDEKGAFVDNYLSGKNHVTRHANVFAILYDVADEKQKDAIVRNVLLNDEITPITTPYFEGYELDVMGKIGRYDHIEQKIRTYWKGMLDLGATTVWEEYDPTLSGAEHYAMYGDKYGKSLCHAWGAAPIYLLGKYFLGVRPTADGYERFEVKPYRGGFSYIKGTVPINGGEVRVELSNDTLSVTATKDGGTLVWDGKEIPLKANVAVERKLS